MRIRSAPLLLAFALLAAAQPARAAIDTSAYCSAIRICLKATDRFCTEENSKPNPDIRYDEEFCAPMRGFVGRGVRPGGKPRIVRRAIPHGRRRRAGSVFHVGNQPGGACGGLRRAELDADRQSRGESVHGRTARQQLSAPGTDWQLGQIAQRNHCGVQHGLRRLPLSDGHAQTGGGGSRLHEDREG